MKQIRGFTLLELLMALSLLALTLGLLLAASTRSARQVQQAQDQNVATLLAENILADIGYGIALTPGQTEGDFDDKKYRWQLSIEPANNVPGISTAAMEASNTMLYEMTLDICWHKKKLRWHRLQTAPLMQSRSP